MKKIWLIVLLLLCALPSNAQDTTDLSGIKNYLQERVNTLQTNTEVLTLAAQHYYDMAQATNFDYAALWSEQPAEAASALLQAKHAWLLASPLYEQVEGIVAGVPSLSEFDVILDAGVSGVEDPVNGVPFNLELRDGRTLERPGNLFGILESTLWGTRPEFSSGITADLNLNSSIEFGEMLPEANVLLAAAETMQQYSAELTTAAEAWQPSLEDAFTALVVMTPTMSEYFASWRESRFIAGDETNQAEFVVISRLSDIQDILSGLIVIYENVSPNVAAVDTAQDEQIHQSLLDLRDYVNDLYQQEQTGRVFTAEEADFFGNEAQDRAMQITGQITQVAALLNITLADE